MRTDGKKKIIKNEGNLYGHAGPTDIDEIKELYSYEYAICKIKYKTWKDGNLVDASGTGFFCEINDDNIPFKKVLFTCNHILNAESIKNNKEIKFEYLNKINVMKMINRKVFTNVNVDYTCIEIFDKDQIKKFFQIDKNILINQDELRDKEIFILQYPGQKKLFFGSGRIINIKNDLIMHTV